MISPSHNEPERQMKQTRRTLFAQNTQLQAQLAACGPDATLSRRQLRERLSTARKEVDALTARVSALTANVEALDAALAVAKKQKTAQTA
jgi:cell division protein FtsB